MVRVRSKLNYMPADGTSRRPPRRDQNQSAPADPAPSPSPDGGDLDATGAFLRHLEQLDLKHVDVAQLVRDLEVAETAVRAGSHGAALGDGPIASPVPSAGVLPLVAATSAIRPKAALTNRTPVRLVEAQPTYQTGADSPTNVDLPPVVGRPGNERPFASPIVLVCVAIIVAIVVYILWRPRDFAHAPAAAASTQGAAVATAPRVESARVGAGSAFAPTASTVPATPPASTAVPSLADLTETARQLYRTGARAQALDAIAQGMSLQADDRNLRTLLAQALSDARAEFNASRRAARAANGAGTPSFVDAERRGQESARLSARAPTIDAVRTYWAATDVMTTVVTEAKQRAGAVAPSVGATPTAAVVTPAATPTSAPLVQTPAQTADSSATASRSVEPAASPLTPVPEAPTLRQPDPSPPAPAVDRGAAPATAPRDPQVAGPSEAPRAPARTLAADEQSIRTVLSAYADAHSRLDAAAVRAIYPATDVAALQRTFSRMRSQRVQILNEQIQVTGATAIVSCVWQTVFELDAGAPNRSAPRTTLTLQRSGDTWVIVSRR